MVTYGLSTAIAIGCVALFTTLGSTAYADVTKVEQAINKAKSAQIKFYDAVPGGQPKFKGAVWYQSGNYRVELPGETYVVLKSNKAWKFDAKTKTWKEQKGKRQASLYEVTRQVSLSSSVPTREDFEGQIPDGPVLTGTIIGLPFDSQGKVARLRGSEFVASGLIEADQSLSLWREVGPAEVVFVANKSTALPKAMATYAVDNNGRKTPTGYATFSFNSPVPKDLFQVSIPKAAK